MQEFLRKNSVSLCTPLVPPCSNNVTFTAKTRPSAHFNLVQCYDELFWERMSHWMLLCFNTQEWRKHQLVKTKHTCRITSLLGSVKLSFFYFIVSLHTSPETQLKWQAFYTGLYCLVGFKICDIFSMNTLVILASSLLKIIFNLREGK